MYGRNSNIWEKKATRGEDCKNDNPNIEDCKNYNPNNEASTLKIVKIIIQTMKRATERRK